MPIKHRLLTIATALGGVGLFSTAAYAAGTGYTTTTSPVPSGTPGGYTQVVTAQTVLPNATTSTTISVTVDNSPTQIVVPPGAFSTPVQVIVTAPVLSQVTTGVASLGYSGYTAMAGLGVNVVTSSGQAYQGSFLKPIGVTVDNAQIGSSDKVVEWNAQGTFSTVSPVSFSAGKASWTFQHDPAFAVLAPKTSVVPSATSPVTGKPFLEEALVGLTLMGAGSLVLFRTRRQRRSS